MERFRIYGNEYIKNKLSSMIIKGRMIPSILIYGEKGLGKSEMAKYIAASLNCEKHSGSPCSECRSCRMILHSNHPDVIYVTPSSKSGLYRVKEDIRPIVSDAYIPPNESGKKIYIIDDAQKLNAECQNALLKVFEEPPGETVFILTADNKQSVLETVLSRVFSFEMSRVSQKQAEAAIIENGFDEVKSSDAQSAFPGNIGKQLEYLNGGDLFDAVVIARTIIDAAVSKNEYELLKAYSQLTDRETAQNVIDLIMEILSSAVEYSTGAEVYPCAYNEGAKRLSNITFSKRIAELYDTLAGAKDRIQNYANLNVLTAVLAAETTKLW